MLHRFKELIFVAKVIQNIKDGCWFYEIISKKVSAIAFSDIVTISR